MSSLHAPGSHASRVDGKIPLCDQCGDWLTGRQRRFCSSRCNKRFSYRKRAAIKRGKEAGMTPEQLLRVEEEYSRPNHGKGELRIRVEDVRFDTSASYDQLERGGYFQRLLDGEITEGAAAAAIGVAQSTVSKQYRYWLANNRFREEREQRKDLRADVPPLHEDNVDQLVDHFADFRVRYFQTPDGRPYLFPDHQRRWLRQILLTMIDALRTEILSPPRHGKSELLAHVCVWLIACVNPNIRILIVGGNQDIAANSVGMVRDQLEDNEQLIDDWCPGRTFRPRSKSGDPWTSEKFTVATRTVSGIKSPTMIAVGRGGKILSRDADLIVCDDIEDSESTMSADQREKTRRWWAITLMSRKEEATGLVVIGSRQHPDDLYGHLLADEGWHHIVEQMHDEACDADPDDLDGHIDCMLWPEVRTYRYMRQLVQDPTIRPHFSMVYLNQPQESGTSTFPRDLVDSCLHGHRTIGDIPDHPSVRLIAGLDPAGTGYQAAFLWAINQRTGDRYAVDMDNRLGGGIQRIREIVKDWHDKYGCRWWVIEENAFQSAILRDELLNQLASQLGVTLEGHSTYGNKWDPQLGVSTLANWMEAGQVSIPYMTDDDQAKFREFRRQLINFSRENTRRHRSDVVMASWFPEERIQEWVRNWAETTHHTGLDDYYVFEPLAYSSIQVA